MDKAFTKPIQSFFLDLENWDWKVKWKNVIFFRDFYDLPISSPKDIDLIIDSNIQKKFIDHIKEKTILFDLYCFSYKTLNNSHILIFDLNSDHDGRSWAYLEIRDKLVINKKADIFVKDINIEFKNNFKIPTPTKEWCSFFEIYQGIKTNNFKKMNNSIKKHKIKINDSKYIFENVLGIDLDYKKRDILYKKISDNIIKRKKQKINKLPLKTKINSFFFKNFYFIHFFNTTIFSTNGPDGVGKTTAISQIEQVFKKLPLNFVSHHHITSWKHPKDANEKFIEKNKFEVSFSHLILRFIYRNLLPISFQKNYGVIHGYHFYLSKLNQLIFKETKNNNIILFDRYIYDLGVKYIINKIGWQFIHKIFFNLARPMIRTYNLHDDPKSILTRKQELTIKEIEFYQKKMVDIGMKNDLNIKNIYVGKNGPKEIANLIVIDILNQCSENLFFLFRSNQNNKDN